jgi:hypothetical protein
MTPNDVRRDDRLPQEEPVLGRFNAISPRRHPKLFPAAELTRRTRVLPRELELYPTIERFNGLKKYGLLIPA